MIRPIISYALTSLVLLSQVGLPLHMHYCKGILESVSVLFAAKCDEHAEMANLPACCKKALAQHCIPKEGKKCCDDEVLVLKQNITSTAPSFVKWIDTPVISDFLFFPQLVTRPEVSHVTKEGNNCDAGPPLFILHQALIFYA